MATRKPGDAGDRPIKKKAPPPSGEGKRRPQPGAPPRPTGQRPAPVKKKVAQAPPPDAPKKKKKKKRRHSNDNSGLIIALVAIGVFVLLAGGGAVVFLMTKKGEDSTPAFSVTQLPQRTGWSKDSEDPKEWRTSPKAFVANFKAERVSEKTPTRKIDRYKIEGGNVVLPSEESEISWEAWLKGPDRRLVTNFAPVEGKKAFLFEMPKLPDPLHMTFLIDNDQADALAKLSFQRVRFKGRLWPIPKSMFEMEGVSRFAVEQLKLSPENPVCYLDEPTEGEFRATPNICLIYCEITEFEPLGKGS